MIKIIESHIVTEPGFYRMPPAAYHAGPTPAPELSSSIAKILVRKSPLHAFTVHSKLGRATDDGDDEPSESEREKATNAQDFGSAVHKLALGFGAAVAIIDPTDHVGPRGGVPKGWTNDSIRGARNEAQARGEIPLLVKHHERAAGCSAALRRAAEAWLGLPMEECLREVVLAWQDASGVWCKAMVDAMRPDMLRTADLKSTAISVAAESVERHLYAEDMEVQAAFYTRGQDALQPENAGRRRFAFIFGETKAPHATSPPMVPSGAGMTLGSWAVESALATFARCLNSGEWPGYPQHAHEAMPPAWKMNTFGNTGA